MTVDVYDPATITYTVSGTGPYAVDHAYGLATDFEVSVVDADDEVTVLDTDDWSILPAGPAAAGDLTLGTTAATTHAGLTLRILRVTAVEQGWAGVSPRERGLEAQIDRNVLALQEARRDMGLALKVRGGPVADYTPEDGHVPMWDAVRGGFVNGPDGADLASAVPAAVASAAAAAESEAAAALAAAEAEANAYMIPVWQGAWVTATDYEVSDLVRQDGSTYFCVEDHTSGTFATDLSAAKWELFASKGTAGVGSGDMLAEENLGDLDNIVLAKINLELHAVATSGSYDDLDDKPTILSAGDVDAAIDAALDALPDGGMTTLYDTDISGDPTELEFTIDMDTYPIVEVWLDNVAFNAGSYLKLDVGQAGYGETISGAMVFQASGGADLGAAMSGTTGGLIGYNTLAAFGGTAVIRTGALPMIDSRVAPYGGTERMMDGWWFITSGNQPDRLKLFPATAGRYFTGGNVKIKGRAN